MNPRNTASGSLKLQDSGEVRKRNLSAVLYQFVSENSPAETHFELLQQAKTWGFKISENAKLCKIFKSTRFHQFLGRENARN